MGLYAFEDKVLDNGNKISRDNTMLKAIDLLSVACGVQDAVKGIDASDWDDMIRQVKKLVVGKQISTCIGGKEYTNKGGYKEFRLFFPKPKSGKYAFGQVGEVNVMTYDESDITHLIKEKAAKSVDSFEPPKSADDDFNLF